MENRYYKYLFLQLVMVYDSNLSCVIKCIILIIVLHQTGCNTEIDICNFLFYTLTNNLHQHSVEIVQHNWPIRDMQTPIWENGSLACSWLYKKHIGKVETLYFYFQGVNHYTAPIRD
jgi:hypothetical protein